MKQDDFERLKTICEKEGFEFLATGKTDDFSPEFITVQKKKDPWEGVEFFEVTGDIACYTKGRIYKITDKSHVYILNSIDDSLIEGSIGFEYIKPSTESAYVEQLKKEAFERFGEIKEGDRFKDPNESEDKADYGFKEFEYYKPSDSLYFRCVKLYEQGKWAERVKERLTGSFSYYSILWPSEEGGTVGFAFKGFTDNEGNLPIDDLDDAGKFLASQLEKYLNGEIE